MKKKSNKTKDNLKDNFNELYQNPRGKAIIFFVGYFFFFLFLYTLMHTGNNNSNSFRTTEYEKGKGLQVQVKALLDKNYLFDYRITQDEVVNEYIGEKYKDKEMFTFQNNKYYFEKDKYYIEESDKWVETQSPYIYSEFLDMKSVFKILSLATYDSKTSYESGQTKYNFLISTNTLNKELHKVNSDFFEEPNSVVLSVNDKEQITSIVFMLDSYCTLNQACQKSLKIELVFDKCGQIEGIDSPLEDNK